jgi:hypothetical protein
MATKTKKRTRGKTAKGNAPKGNDIKLLDMVKPPATARTARLAKRVLNMRAAELNKHIELCNETAMRTAPTMKSVKSDLLILLQVLSRAFVEKYYPAATSASININRYGSPIGDEHPTEFHIHLPVYDRASVEQKGG